MPFACIVKPLNGAISGHAAVYGKNGSVAETKKTIPTLEGNIESFAKSLVDGLLKDGAENVLRSIGLNLPS